MKIITQISMFDDTQNERINIEANDFIIPAGTKNSDKINPNLL